MCACVCVVGEFAAHRTPLPHHAMPRRTLTPGRLNHLAKACSMQRPVNPLTLHPPHPTAAPTQPTPPHPSLSVHHARSPTQPTPTLHTGYNSAPSAPESIWAPPRRSHGPWGTESRAEPFLEAEEQPRHGKHGRDKSACLTIWTFHGCLNTTRRGELGLRACELCPS